MMSLGTQNRFNLSSALNFSESKPNLKTLSSDHLNFCKSSFPLKPQFKSSTRTSPVKASAAAAEPVDYVSTQNLYELLGISETGTLSEIKNAYRQLARKYHPDVSPPDRTEEYTKRFLEVQEAYETLSDPESRASYDRELASGLGLHSLFNGRKRSSSKSRGFVDREEWQSQLEELIRSRNSNVSERMSWGARMRSKRWSSIN